MNNFRTLASRIIACATMLQFASVALGGSIYWTDESLGTIKRANVDGTNIQTVVSGLTSPNALAYDSVYRQLYWIDGGSFSHFIKRANLDGSGITTVLTVPSNNRDGMAIDSQLGRMFWTFQSSGGGADGINYANLDGTNLQTITTGNFSGPRGISLDITNQQIYFADILNDNVGRVNYNGTGLTIINSDPHYTSSPSAIAYNPSNSKLYWTAHTFNDLGVMTGGVVMANANGSDPQSIETVSSSRLGMVVDGEDGKIIWTDAQRNNIESSNFDGSGLQVLISSGLVGPHGIVFVPEPNSITMAVMAMVGCVGLNKRRLSRRQ